MLTDTGVQASPRQLGHPTGSNWALFLISVLLQSLLWQVDQCDGFKTVFTFSGEVKDDGLQNGSDRWTRVSMQLPTQQDGIVFRPSRPISIYGRAVDTLTVFRNGLVGLDDESVNNLPRNYPADTANTGQRLQHIDGRYVSAFTSVNDGPMGLIDVSEVNLTGKPPLTCSDIRQLNRLQKVIRLSYPSDAAFRANMVVSIAWNNMTTNTFSKIKTNSYKLLLLTNSKSAYAVLQYVNITWPKVDKPVVNALPPEAGIFMQPHGGFQLPRSGHSVKSEVWTTESNVGIPGEWIIPLDRVSVTSKELVIKKLPEIIDEFMVEWKSPCTGDEIVEGAASVSPSGVMHDSPRYNGNQTHPPIEVRSGLAENYFYPYTADYDYLDIMYNENGSLPTSDLEGPLPGGNGVAGEPFVEVRTEYPMGVYDGDESRPVTIEPEIVTENFIPLEAGNSSWATNHSTSETGYPMSPSECSPNSQCKDRNAECIGVNGVTCCVCPPGHYGNGAERCWRNDDDEKFVFNGNLVAQLDSKGQATSLPVYLDIQHGQVIRSSSGLQSGRRDHPVYANLRFITPVFHVLNSLISSSCANNSWASVNQVFSVFTLADAFRKPVDLQFYLNVDYVGEFTVRATLTLDHATAVPGLANGNLSMEVKSERPVQMVTRHYREVKTPGAGDAKANTHYASFYVDTYKRIVFPGRTVTFKADSQSEAATAEPDELTARWSAVASLQDEESGQEGCLLRAESVVPQSKQTYVRFKEKGYCNEECRDQDASCNLFCIDEPVLLGHEPMACDCVKCGREGEVCVPEGESYSCTCRPGLRRMDDQTCRPDETLTRGNSPKLNVCGGVTCHANAKCLSAEQSLCQCLPGFRGDGVGYCDEDHCARCRPDEVCVNDTCQPSGVDICRDVRCGKNAFCQDGTCVCTPGFTGDPSDRCVEEGELCAGVKCHQFGQCYENRCYCSHGYVGDGVNFCDSRTEDKCLGVRCAQNARCHDGQCSCDPGFKGDGYNECQPEDRCTGVQCHSYAQCHDGLCKCLIGYSGDGYQNCIPSTQGKSCADVRCHPDAQCREGQCSCRTGFYGDGYYECIRESIDPCSTVQCHYNASCENGYCKCLPGYQGDGYYDCYPTGGIVPSQCNQCRGMPVSEIAQCVEGQCVCATGYVMLQPGLCVECVKDNCHTNADCLPNQAYKGAYSCQCLVGYTGDGIQSCQPSGRVEIDPTCGGVCQPETGFCNQTTGKCQCKEDYVGDGVTHCTYNYCRCAPNADCNPREETCTCRPGYRGDGKTYCERIPDVLNYTNVNIYGQGGVMRLTDVNQPLELRCQVTHHDRFKTGKWIPPIGAQTPSVDIGILPNGHQLTLRISQPTLNDAGRYICRFDNLEQYIDVAISETATAYDIYLTSDDGILRVNSTSQNVTTAVLWNIAENNKYGKVAMVTDCNTDSVIYTSNYGNTIRWGKAHELNSKLVHTAEIFNSQLSRFRNLAIDPPSGNIFAWDEAYGKIVVVNKMKPHMRYTLNNINTLRQDGPVRLAGLSVHPTRGLLYWAMFTDGWRPNGTIQVASMNGENEAQVLQLSAEPMAILVVPSTSSRDGYAGRLCWFQRSISVVFNIATELHCARLSQDGRHIVSQERVRRFSASEEPSWGLTHHEDTTLWTDASKTIYNSIGPNRRVKVRRVCCSNRFQAIAVLAKCPREMKNVCGYSNGRCQYFCLPGGDEKSRTCVCPDSEPGCHREV